MHEAWQAGPGPPTPHLEVHLHLVQSAGVEECQLLLFLLFLLIVVLLPLSFPHLFHLTYHIPCGSSTPTLLLSP